MHKKEFVLNVAAKFKTVKPKAVRNIEQVINATLETITEELVQGGKVQLSGFGTFEVRERMERSGINPRTGEPIIIPTHKTIHFTPSGMLKWISGGFFSLIPSRKKHPVLLFFASRLAVASPGKNVSLLSPILIVQLITRGQ